MRTVIETTVYTFNELSDRAKERAREWYREGALDYDWYDSVYEQAVEIGGMLGIEFDQKGHRTMGGQTRYSPAIYFSGFASQGDGACFEGRYAYKAGSVKAVHEFAPQDTTLHAIAAGLAQVQRRNFYQLSAVVKHSGHYHHSGCTTIEVMRADDEHFYNSYYRDDNHDGAEIVSLLRRFMDWIYSQLESEWEYLNSDEQVDESLEANEYTFTEDGERFG